MTAATLTHNIESLLTFCIAFLNKIAVEVPPARRVFATVTAILALVRVSTLVLHPPAISH